MESLVASIRSALRSLRRTPSFTLIAVATLAIGIASTTAVFSVVYSVLIRSLPYPDSDRVVGVWHTAPGLGFDQFEQSDATYSLYRRHSTVFEEMGVSRAGTVNLTGDGRPEEVTAALITPSVLAVLGCAPQLGRSFLEAEERPGEPPTAILSHGLWTRRFAADPGVIGRVVQLDGVSHTVVGVMPPGFAYPSPQTQVWRPLVIDPADLSVSSFNYQGVARLKGGVEPAAAAADLTALVRRLPEEYPSSGFSAAMLENAGMACRVHPLRDDVVGDVKVVLHILLGTVGVILLIACANVASLFVARLEGRHQEVVVRTALGASRHRVARVFATEALLLSLAGGALGAVLAAVALRVLLRLAPNGIPRLDEIRLDGAALGFTLLVTLVSTLLFGLLPALRAVPDVGAALRDGSGRTTVGRGGVRARGVLVAAQLALALVLTVGSGLLVRSFAALRGVEPGFDAGNVLTLRVSLPDATYPRSREAASFFAQVLERVRALPGVVAASTVTGLPLTANGSNNGYTIEDQPLPPGQVPPILYTEYVAPDFFRTLGIPLAEGRAFEPGDVEQPTHSVVVSASLARRLWPGSSPLGRRVTSGVADGDSVWHTVIGVVGDVRYRGLEQEPTPMLYFPILHQESAGEDQVVAEKALYLVMRTAVPPVSLVDLVREAIWQLDPNLPVADIRTLADVERQASARTGFTMLLLLVAGAVALALGAVGLYAVVAHSVSSRTREIGVRMALGADRARVSRMVLGQGLSLAAAGLGGGVLAALGVTRVLRSMLYDVSPVDVVTFLTVSVVLLAVAGAASWLPARRAAALDPIEALRNE